MTEMAQTNESLEPAYVPETLMAYLKDMSIEFSLCHHEAFFTVEQGLETERNIPGTHCRNLFLRDRKKKNFLLVLRNETEVDMKKLPDVLGSDRLSFGSAERLWEYLGVKPGSVCPYAIINDTGHNVEIVLDKSMMETELVNYHPLINTMTIGTTPANLTRFVESTGHKAHIVDLTSAKPDEIEGL